MAHAEEVRQLLKLHERLGASITREILGNPDGTYGEEMAGWTAGTAPDGCFFRGLARELVGAQRNIEERPTILLLLLLKTLRSGW